MIVALLLSCGDPPAPTAQPTPAPARAPAPAEAKAPTVAFRLPERQAKTPAPIGMTPELEQARAVLEKVVVDHARDPDNPWAIVHGMLALGPSMKLTNDADPVDWMFEHYGEIETVGGEDLIDFPNMKRLALVEPHTDLILKGLTEAGLTPDRAVKVGGRDFTLAALYRHSLHQAWVAGDKTGYQGATYNDTPWALQGLAAWAPPDLAWSAVGGRPMTMSGFTDAVVQTLHAETKEMAAAAAAGQVLQKDTRKGLFRYTCGGQHLLQGAAYAVGRGFGNPADKTAVCVQLDLLRWRIDVELGAIDPILASGQADANIGLVLLSQRLKFLGHWLETTHKIGALGICPLDADDVAASERVATEIVRTVAAIEQLGVWKDVGAVRQNRALDPIRPNGGAQQVYLDLVGDSAHAVRGIDLATGAGTLPH